MMAMFGSRFQGSISFPQLETSGVASMATPVPAPAARPAAFDRGGMGWDILGGVSDGILALNGMTPVYGPSAERRRTLQAKLTQEEARYQRQRTDRITDWQMQQQWKIDHPAPQEPNALERNFAFLEAQRPGLGATYADNFANNGGGVPQIITTPQGTFAVPRSAMTGATAGSGSVPGAAVSYLRQNPGMAAQFDAKYGVGASARYLGGAAPQAPAPFPIR